MRVPAVSPALSTRAFRLALFALCLVVITGAAVRLTGSGLGCSTWPTCHGHTLTPPWRYQSLIEFGNRMVAVLVTLATAAAVLGAVLRRPRRRDLMLLAAGTLAGVLAQAVLGGLTVLFKLAPGWVMAHFLLSMVVIAVGVVLVHRDGQPDGVGVARVGRETILVSRVMVGLTAVVLGLGTVVTGAGPHSGSTGVARLPISARDAAEMHSTLVMGLVGVTLATLLLLRPASAPPDVERKARVLLAVMVGQGAIGYTQYFTGVPAALVEVHIVGAVLVWLAVLRFHFALHTRVPDPAAAREATEGPEPDRAEPASALTPA
ncbi:MAG: COX15/CtaA family protein [Acidimicrobiales bacterium]